MFLIPFAVFIFGLCIGSFLNVVILRLEKNESLGGRSYCPHCKHSLVWLDLIPVFSFLFLRGKCRYCKGKISRQYPIIEISTGLIFLLISNYQVSIINSALLFYVTSALIVIFVYDLKHFIIPDKILFPAIVITFLYRLIDNWKLIIGNYSLAAILASGFFLAIFLISKGRWMGFGDVKLAILMGLLLGFPNILVALLSAFWLGALVGIVLMLLSKKGLKSELPFAPFLITGTFLALIWGQPVINWYANFIYF